MLYVSKAAYNLPFEIVCFRLLGAIGTIPVTPSGAKDWVINRRKTVRPWSEFLNTNRFQKPTSIANVGSRAIKNIEYFMSNYLFVFLGLIVFCM